MRVETSCLLLLSLLSGALSSETPPRLRKSEDAPSRRRLASTLSVDADTNKYEVILSCKDEGTYDRIAMKYSGKIKNDMKLSHMVAMSLTKDEIDALDDDLTKSNAPVVVSNDKKRYLIPDDIGLPKLDGRRKLTDEERSYAVTNTKADLVWSNSKGSGATVCVTDTGVAPQDDLPFPEKGTGYTGSNTPAQWDSDVDGHGTHVAGIVSALDNTIGTVGIAPESSLYIINLFGVDGNDWVWASDAITASEICFANGARTINMSWGDNSAGAYDAAEETAYQDLFNQGALLIAAAGNDGDSHNRPTYPAYYLDVMSVAAVDNTGARASFSTFNDRVDVAAPGVAILSLGLENPTGSGTFPTVFRSGTSMASPVVAGVAALLWAEFPQATNVQIRDAIFNGCPNPNSPTTTLGRGLVNAQDSRAILEALFNVNPTVSLVPSDIPSKAPSRAPSKSQVPSDIPSQVPSRAPSLSVLPTSDSNCPSGMADVSINVLTDSDRRSTRVMLIHMRRKYYRKSDIVLKEKLTNPSTAYAFSQCVDLTNECYGFLIKERGGFTTGEGTYSVSVGGVVQHTLDDPNVQFTGKCNLYLLGECGSISTRFIQDVCPVKKRRRWGKNRWYWGKRYARGRKRWYKE